MNILCHAPRLETLDLTMYAQSCEQGVDAWPPDLRLPRLYSVRLKFNKRFLVMHCFPFVPTEGHDRSEAYCLALRSLLKAHYGQITAVSLRSESREPSLQPLLEVCSPKLQRLAIERDVDPVGILMAALTSGKGKFASLTSLDLSSSPPDLRRLGDVLARLPSVAAAATLPRSIGAPGGFSLSRGVED
ncbi:hypothetical protein FOCC_FOCC001912 [Frankliniella occidentalis]|nr:hypothetical protein FOCC_FOCC001912 [Frankliniella occidentalis]